MSERYVTFFVSSLSVLAVCVLFYTSCKQEFIGHNVPKPKSKIVSPEEREPSVVRNGPTPVPIGPIGGEAGGGFTVTLPGPNIVEPEAIEIEVIQSSSESWWRNCLLARSMYSPSWVRVACNKGASSQSGIAKLPGVRGLCNAVSIRIETYRNIGDECARRAAQGLGCEGPYPSVPDVLSDPAFDATVTTTSKTSAFSVYHANNLDRPDPLILANEGWTLPAFDRLASDMAAWLNLNPRNRWYRFFYEDQSADSIARARSQPQSALPLGVDYNDYVFDVRSKAIEVGIEGTRLACP